MKTYFKCEYRGRSAVIDMDTLSRHYLSDRIKSDGSAVFLSSIYRDGMGRMDYPLVAFSSFDTGKIGISVLYKELGCLVSLGVDSLGLTLCDSWVTMDQVYALLGLQVHHLRRRASGEYETVLRCVGEDGYKDVSYVLSKAMVKSGGYVNYWYGLGKTNLRLGMFHSMTAKRMLLGG